MLPTYIKPLSNQKKVSDNIILGMHVFYTMNGSIAIPRNEYLYAAKEYEGYIHYVTFPTYKRRLEKLIRESDKTIIFLEDKRFYDDTIKRVKAINPANRFMMKTKPIDYNLCDTNYKQFAEFLQGHHVTLIGGLYRGDTTFCSKESAKEYGCVGALSWELRKRKIEHDVDVELTFK